MAARRVSQAVLDRMRVQAGAEAVNDLPSMKGYTAAQRKRQAADYRRRREDILARRLKSEGYASTPSGKVAQAQRAQAERDSPLAATPKKKPAPSKRPSDRILAKNARAAVASTAPVGDMLSFMQSKAREANRTLSRDPRQVARRASRGFPSGY